MINNIHFAITSLFLLIAGSSVIAQSVGSVDIQGNHVTDSSVIMRELCFQPGDSIDFTSWPEQIKQSEKNLMNTSLFVYVNINWKQQGNQVDVSVAVKERWYYWLYPILEHADRNLSAFIYNADWKKINYGLSFEKHNLFGKNQFLKLKARFGYRQQLGILYENPAINASQFHGFQLYADRFRQRQVAVENVKDRRQYFYQPDKPVIYEDRAGFIYISRPDLYQSLRFISEFRQFAVSDSMFSAHPSFLHMSQQSSSYFNIRLQYEFDNRDDRFFPLKGFLLLSDIEKTGFGLFAKSPDFMTGRLKLHWHHSFTEKWFYAMQANSLWHITNADKRPYYLSGILGYDYYPRGYEYYTVHGKAVVNINQSVRYRLISRQKVPLSWVPVREFDELKYDVYLYAFWDNAKTWSNSLYGNDNELPEAFLTSGGAGIECHTFYDRSFGFHFAFTNQKAFGIFAWFHSPLYKNY